MKASPAKAGSWCRPNRQPAWTKRFGTQASSPIAPNSARWQRAPTARTSTACPRTDRANGSRYGGITGYRVAEGADITASGPQKFYKYTLKPKEYAAVAYLTNEVLNDARLLEQELSSGRVAELAFMLDDDMFRGLGVAGAYGWTLHPSRCDCHRKKPGRRPIPSSTRTSSRCGNGAMRAVSYAWFVNQDAEPQLDLLYQAAGTAGIPPRFVTYGEDGVMRIKGAPVVVD